MAGRAEAFDPKPLPPREPEPGECCQSGCAPCVYDRYWEALERYEKALGEWLLRHPGEATAGRESQS